MAKRKIPCIYCKGTVLATQNGRGTSSQSLFPRAQNFLTAISDLITALMGGQKGVSRKDAIGGKCEACGDKGEIEDPTDTSEQDKACADFLNSQSKKLTELETKLGNSPGGSMLERIAGAKVTIVGRTLNTAKSVTVHEGKAKPPTKNVVSKAGPTTAGSEKGTNAVTGNNPPANTGGGIYYIQCGNKFKLTAGAQGIEMASYGPISIDGTQVRITGAEVSIGGNSGPTLLEGDHLQINGKSIALSPSGSAGEVVIQGSASCTGNLKAGGGYIENMYCASMTMPSTQASTKPSSGSSDYIAGPAKWGGPSGELQALATQNLVKWIKDSTTDINLAGTLSPLNPRSIMKTNDNIINYLYSLLPQELIQTGIAVISYGSSAGTHPIYNFPHSHQLPDAPHTHDMTVPAISHDGNSSADVVRKKFSVSDGKIPAGPSKIGDGLVSYIANIGSAASNLSDAFQGLYKV